MVRNKKLCAAIICAIFILTLLFSFVFIIMEANHHCTGEDCPICHEIKVCITAINTLGTVSFAILSVFVLRFTIIYAVFIYVAYIPIKTLVSLNIKLSE